MQLLHSDSNDDSADSADSAAVRDLFFKPMVKHQEALQIQDFFPDFCSWQWQAWSASSDSISVHFSGEIYEKTMPPVAGLFLCHKQTNLKFNSQFFVNQHAC